MSVLLLRVSGVALLEKNLSKTRPGYEENARITNAFFPGTEEAGPSPFVSAAIRTGSNPRPGWTARP